MDGLIPCDLCEFVSKSTDEYLNHVKTKHSNNKKNAEENKGSEPQNTKDTRSNKNRNREDSNVRIPCDICDYTAWSSDDFIKHIETKHQQKLDGGSRKSNYECERSISLKAVSSGN